MPDRNLPIVRLPITIKNVEVIDKRINISPGKIKIPIATYDETYVNLKGQGIPVRAIVHILDSYMEYGSLMFAQREKGVYKN